MSHANKWKGGSDWIFSYVTQPARPRKIRLIVIIAGLLSAIAVVDYWSGIHISLAVFYLVPILLATAWLGRLAAVVVVFATGGLRLSGDFLANGQQMLPFSTWWNSLSALLVFLFIVWVFGNLLSLYRQLEKRVEERTAELLDAAKARRRLEHELLVVGSRERNAFGQELHDDICQHLVGTAMAAKVLAQQLSDQKSGSAAGAEAIVNMVEAGADKTRRLARGLLLSSIDPEQLGEKLTELVEEGNQSSVLCRFHQEGDILTPDAGTAAQLFRIAQEAFRNALKHANAQHIHISLLGSNEAISLIVEDDGQGLPLPAERGPGMGLRIMSNRAAYIGGTLSLAPVAERGTRVTCRLPRGQTA